MYSSQVWFLRCSCPSICTVFSIVAPEYRPAYKAMFSPEMLEKKVFSRELRCEEDFRQSKEPLLGIWSERDSFTALDAFFDDT